MNVFVRNLTIGLAVMSALAGAFIESLLHLFVLQVPSTLELRWSLIVGMPIVLFVSFTWLNLQPARTISTALLQSFGQVALFLAPVWWVANHAQ